MKRIWKIWTLGFCSILLVVSVLTFFFDRSEHANDSAKMNLTTQRVRDGIVYDFAAPTQISYRHIGIPTYYYQSNSLGENQTSFDYPMLIVNMGWSILLAFLISWGIDWRRAMRVKV